MRNKSLKILTIGGAVQDFTLQTDRGVVIDNAQNITQQKLVGFEFGAKINIKNADFTFGGGATNSAVSLAKLDNTVSALICVGRDILGDEIIRNLKDHKVRIELIQRSDLASGVTVVLKNSNFNKEHVLFTSRGANSDLKINTEFLPRHGRANKLNFDMIYLTSLSSKKFKSNIAKIFRFKRDLAKLLARKNKIVKLAWNPGNLQIKMGLSGLRFYLKETDIFIVNKDEAIEICLEYKNKIRLNNIRELLKILSEYCQGVVVITNGYKGAYAIYNKKIYYSESCNVKVTDTTGVGDAFGSTFSWALLITGYDIQKSLKFAIKNACSVLQKTGAQNGLLSVKDLK
ncbi:carbohydrate kinase family protein [Patescibacteria group bacterium]|nr:carbohydrate kinase family protein [Patescibacteria group bacterium]